jgi:L-iditol 2-dehydrogenase
MIAGVYRSKGRVCVEDIPVPKIGLGEALVRIAACGVCGTDLKKIHLGLADPPRVFGHEMAGTIEALGVGVEGWSVGDRVAVMHHVPCLDCYFCERRAFAQCLVYKRTGTTAGFEPSGGGFAERIRVMDWVVRRGMVRIPDDVSFEEATFIEPLNTVVKGVERAAVRAGDTAVVMGQGQIGLLFNQVLKDRGVRVIGSDPIAWRREQGLKFGAAAVVDPSDGGSGELIRQDTDGRGADLAIVAVANNRVIPGAFRMVRPGGKVLLFAQTRMDDLVVIDAGQVCMLEKDLIGSYSADIGLQQACAEMIFSRQIDVRGLITHRFPLSDIGQAIELAANPSAGALKVMVEP